MPSAVLIAGTRDAQVAMLRPLARKMAKTAVRHRTTWERDSTVSMSTPYRIDSIRVVTWGVSIEGP
ncbi:hypothetical protein GCM10027058_14490 [Microbacterium neimengense]